MGAMSMGLFAGATAAVECTMLPLLSPWMKSGSCSENTARLFLQKVEGTPAEATKIGTLRQSGKGKARSRLVLARGSSRGSDGCELRTQ